MHLLIDFILLQVFASDVDSGVNGLVTFDLMPTERNVTIDPQSVSYLLESFCYLLIASKIFFLNVKLTSLCWQMKLIVGPTRLKIFSFWMGCH